MATESGGTCLATQTAERPVKSGITWKSQASLPSAMARASPASGGRSSAA